MRGYLSASPTEDGAEIEYVWDVFTADKQRVQRLNDVIEVKGAGDDPWALAGEAALTSVAAKSADDLAAFLSNTPEAAPAAAAAEPPPAETALGYAPLQIAPPAIPRILWIDLRRRAGRRLAVILFPAAAAAMTRPNLAPRGLGTVRACAPIGAPACQVR